MKGVVFNLLEEVVSLHHGPATWDALLDGLRLDGAYTSLGNYPDEDMEKLVGAASASLRQSPGEVLRWFGREAMPFLAQRYPGFFTAHKSTRPFILSLNHVIHAEVHKLYAGAVCPHFRYVDESDGALRLGYRSPRKLCSLAHGFIEGAAGYYHETIAVEHLKCMNEGDPECQLQVRFQ